MTLDTVLDDDVRGWLGTAARSTDRILDTSEKLRVTEQSNLTTTSSESIDLVDLVGQEIDRLQSSYPDVTIETKLPEQARIRGDQSLGYVIREPIENANEHHRLPEAERMITVDVEKSLSHVTLRIADNGPGIHEDELAALESGQETDLVHAAASGCGS